MALRVEWVPYGRGATDRLRLLIGEAKGGEPLAPVTVVVPSNYVGVATRRWLAGGTLGPVCTKGSGIAAVTFLTPYRLAELLGAARLAAAGRRPVSTPVVAAALRAVLGEAPGVFGPVATHPATETALVAAYRELRDCSEAALDALAATSERAGDVIRIHRAARARLERDWYDEEDLIAGAVAALAERPPGSDPLGLGVVFVYLPQRLTRHAIGLLAALAGAGPLAVVAGVTGDERADAELTASVARLAQRCGTDTEATSIAPSAQRGAAGADDTETPISIAASAQPDEAMADDAGVAAPLAQPGGDPTDPPAPLARADEVRADRPAPSPAALPAVDPDRTRFVSCSDADEEVRVAVRAVVDAARAGVPLDRIAVLYAEAEPYARLVHEHLAAAGIPLNGSAVTPVAARAAGRTLLDLLALPECGFRRQDVFAWLASAPLRHQGRFVPVGAWERLSREAAVVGGVDQWDTLLAHLADERDAAAAGYAADPDSPAWKAERAREEAERARSLREFILDLAGDLERTATTPRRWGELAAWAAGWLHRLLGRLDRWAAWPADERRGAERVELALSRLGALDAVEGPVPLAVFTRTLTLELEDDLGRVGRFGEGVLAGSVAMGLGLDLDLVVVLGLAEGSFPTRPRDDSLLPDHERAAAGGELPLRRESVGRQHRWFLAALAGAGRHHLSVPRGDLRRSVERLPSRFVVDVARPLVDADVPARPDPVLAAGQPWVDHVASFDAGLRRLEFPATDQEHRLRTVLAAGGDPAVAADPLLDAAAEVVAARRSERFTRFDGHLAGLAVPSPVDRVTSTSRLERWAACPLDYLFSHVLGVAPVENPEEALEITALDWGSLVHGALEAFILEVLARPEADRPSPDRRWPAADRARLLDLGDAGWAVLQAAGRAGRPIFWRRDRTRLHADLTRFLDGDDENRARHRTRPLAAELAFGFSGSRVEPVPVVLADGRTVRFRGMADRVDVGDDGTIHIVDYKTGSTFGYEDLSEENPVAAGRKLQLTVYGLAGRLHRAAPDAPVLAEYWFVSKKGDFRRIGYHVTDEILAQATAVIGTVVAGIEAGVFPAHPEVTSTTPTWIGCRACDPDGLGVVELRRAWDRKRHDPALAPYAELAEPLPDDPDEDETLSAGDPDA